MKGELKVAYVLLS